MNTNLTNPQAKQRRSLMEAKEWMQSMAKAFGKYEYKVKYKAEAGMVELKSKDWRDDPPNLKAYKAIDCILPEFLRTKKPQAKDKKKLVQQITKYKENV